MRAVHPPGTPGAWEQNDAALCGLTSDTALREIERRRGTMYTRHQLVMIGRIRWEVREVSRRHGYKQIGRAVSRLAPFRCCLQLLSIHCLSHAQAACRRVRPRPCSCLALCQATENRNLAEWREGHVRWWQLRPAAAAQKPPDAVLESLPRFGKVGIAAARE